MITKSSKERQEVEDVEDVEEEEGERERDRQTDRDGENIYNNIHPIIINASDCSYIS